MTERMIDAVLEEYHDEILVSARARMRGDESMAALATQRDMGESAMVGQVIGFWLAAIRTELLKEGYSSGEVARIMRQLNS